MRCGELRRRPHSRSHPRDSGDLRFAKASALYETEVPACAGMTRWLGPRFRTLVLRLLGRGALARQARPLRQPLVMRDEKVVDELPDLVEIELGTGVRVHHRGVVDVLAVLGE